MSIILRKFYFIRHGKTDWNDRQLCQGQTDVPLNQSGVDEIKAFCPLIQKLPFKRVVTSPLQRALQTAKIIQDETQLPLEVIPELQERYWGSLEGISSQEMYRLEELEERGESLDPQFNVEPRHEFAHRIAKGLNSLLEGPIPLIVSHGRVFLTLTELLNVPPVRQIPHATVVECTPIDGKWKLNQICLSIR